MEIQSIRISGFRSLTNVAISGLGPVNIFYGDNNAGKSNILAALEILFRVERYEEQESPVAAFLKGEISNFIDNFTIKPDGEKSSIIHMHVKLGLNDDDLENIDLFHNFIVDNNIYETGHIQRVEITAEIMPSVLNRAARIITSASVNNRLMYDPLKSELDRFFPALRKKVKPMVTRQRPVEQLFFHLINAFDVIHADRFLFSEVMKDEQEQEISVQQLKNWLLHLGESRGSEYNTFQEIAKWFNTRPFGYGKIRPIVQGDKVDIVVTDDTNRELLIERLGTGVQKILLLLSNLSNSKAMLIGIEELELNLSPRLQSATLSMLRDLITTGKGSIRQLLITSHSMHLGNREDTKLYAISLNDNRETVVERGIKAINSLKGHFDYGFIKIPRSRWLR